MHRRLDNPFLQQSLNVLAQQVELQIHRVTGAFPPQIRDGERMRNQPDRDARVGYFGNCQRNAVDGDAPLVHKMPRIFRRHAYPKIVILTARFEDLDHPQGIDVAGDKVPAHFSPEPKTPFEINQGALAQRGKIRQPPRFRQHIEAQRSRVKSRGGKTAPVDCDTVADRQFHERNPRRNRQLPSLRPVGKGQDAARFLDYSSEHRRHGNRESTRRQAANSMASWRRHPIPPAAAHGPFWATTEEPGRPFRRNAVPGPGRRHSDLNRTTETLFRRLCPCFRVADLAESYSQESEPELLRRAQAGEETAFGILMRAYYEPIFRLVQSIVHDEHAARDVCQEVWLTVWRSLGKFRGEAKFSTWVHPIAVRRAIDHLRGRQRWTKRFLPFLVGDSGNGGGTPEPVADGNPRDDLEKREHAGRFERAIESLPPKYRAVLALREIQGLSYDDIAKSIDVRRGTVMSRLFNARRLLAQKLEDLPCE